MHMHAYARTGVIAMGTTITLNLVPGPQVEAQRKAWSRLEGFPVCAESAYYVNVTVFTRCIFTQQAAVGDGYVESTYQAAARDKSWDSQQWMTVLCIPKTKTADSAHMEMLHTLYHQAINNLPLQCYSGCWECPS